MSLEVVAVAGLALAALVVAVISTGAGLAIGCSLGAYIFKRSKQRTAT